VNEHASYPRLLGDIGGTNARFAWQATAGTALIDIATYPGSAYPSLLDAMQHYLREHGKPAPRWCAIGIANPVVGDEVKMTNRDWSFSISAVKTSLGVDRFLVINDFTALALALPALVPAELMQVGGGAAVAGAPIALLGPGTGLGVSGLLPAPKGGGLVSLNGEGGHVTLAPTNDAEEAVVRELRRRFGHASAERALSGPGLVNLYQALCTLDAMEPKAQTAAEVTAWAAAGTDARCVRAEAIFFSLLGNVAGNLALSLGARGGVYIGGGIVPRMGARILSSALRDSFESKGRFRPYLASIPVYVVHATVPPALVGATRALDEL